jgi:hypothetical protein
LAGRTDGIFETGRIGMLVIRQGGIMGIGVLIIGRSGSGKSASGRNFKNGEVGWINVTGKPLPFKAGFPGASTDNYDEIKNILQKSRAASIVIDDAGYLLTNAFMRGHAGKANKFDFYNELADSFWSLIEHIKTLDKQKIVYVIMHEEESESGTVKPKTLGKLLDNTVCVEGLFTIVLRSLYCEGKYVFSTQTNGQDVAKSPIGMFAGQYIENDLAAVDKRIRDFYSI